MRRLLAAAMMVAATSAVAAPNLLFNSNHAASHACLDAVLPGAANSTVFVDMTQIGTAPATIYEDGSGSAMSIVRAATVATANTWFQVGTNTAINNHPYGVVSSSWSDTMQADDYDTYATALANGVLSNWAYVPNSPWGADAQPPIAGANSDYCTNGTSGYGAEFCLNQSFSVAYPGCDTSTPSSATSSVSQILAALKQQHSGFNWFDVKAAVRQTAANWPTYSPTTYGYGAINYAAANALVATASLFLQPPGMYVTNNGYYLRISLLPYRQTRRIAEVVYAVSAAYTWPAKNEYTTTDLAASGGTLIYTSNGTDVVPVFTYVPAASGTVKLMAFTADGNGNYSAAQQYTANSQSVLVGTACLK